MPTKPFKMDGVTVVAHPLVRHKLSIMASTAIRGAVPSTAAR